MNTFIEVKITRTGKSYSPKDNYRIFDDETKRFNNITEAKTWLISEYGNCRRVAMYQDSKEGVTYQSGYVYGFHNSDMSHSPVERWLQQDWVSIYEVTTKAVTL